MVYVDLARKFLMGEKGSRVRKTIYGTVKEYVVVDNSEVKYMIDYITEYGDYKRVYREYIARIDRLRGILELNPKRSNLVYHYSLRAIVDILKQLGYSIIDNTGLISRPYATMIAKYRGSTIFLLIHSKSYLKIDLSNKEVLEHENAERESLTLYEEPTIIYVDGKPTWVKIGRFYLNIKTQKVYEEFNTVSIAHVELVEVNDERVMMLFKKFLSKNTWLIVEML